MTVTRTTAGNAIVCDDDALVRRVIRQVLADSPIAVVGEAESPAEALAQIERHDADVLVLDLALRGGTGEHLLEELAQHRPDVRVVVYSAYSGDASSLIDRGAAAVVEKPDFAALNDAIDDVAAGLGVPVNRRRDPERDLAELPEPTATSIGGYEPWDSLLAAVAHLRGGEAVLCTDIIPPPELARDWDHAVRADHRVALARLLVRTIRRADRVSVSPDGHAVAVLADGHAHAPTVVFQRLSEEWRGEVDSGTLAGSFGLVRPSEDPIERLRAIENGLTLDVANPFRMV